uniref:Prenyltransferase n=1 Tax=candidate division WOR-3 bacterium TaxID=2052148 RepID=A0A7V0Z7M8_UNCW3
MNKPSVWDYIFLTRPILLIPVWAFFLLGNFWAGGKKFQFNKTFYVGLVVYTFLLVVLYVLNQIADKDSDRINQKHLLIAEGYVTVRQAYLVIIISLIVSFGFSVFLPLSIIIFMCISFIFGILYSFVPFKLKAVPFADFLINGIGYGFLNFTLGWLTLKPFSKETVIHSLPYIFAVSAIFVNTTILDIEGDRKFNYITTGVLLGVKNTALLALFLIICSIISGLYNVDYICLIPAVVSLPLFFLAALKGETKYIQLSIRVGGPLLILITGIVFPYFLILSLIIFIFLRIYYRKKFGISYPSLR